MDCKGNLGSIKPSVFPALLPPKMKHKYENGISRRMISEGEKSVSVQLSAYQRQAYQAMQDMFKQKERKQSFGWNR